MFEAGATDSARQDAGARRAVVTQSSFVDVVREQAERRPDAGIFTFLDYGENESGRLSFAELDRRARAIAGALEALNLRGERVLLVYPPGPDCVTGFYGSLYAGTVAVPSPPPDLGQEYAAERIRTIARDASPRAVMTTGELMPLIRQVLGGSGPDAPDPMLIATDTDDFGSESDWRGADIGSEDVALLQYTSGSTSVPRGVMVTHRNLLENCGFVSRVLDDPDETRGVMWLPPYHDMGLIGGLLQPVFSGFPITLMSPVTFLLRPLSWLRAIDRYRATISAAPDFAFELCVRRTRPEHREGLDLSSWRIAFNGAEIVRRETIDAFSEAFAGSGFRRSTFYPCYGLAEATLIVTGGEAAASPVTHDADLEELDRGRFVPAERPERASKSLVGCGQPGPGTRIVIVDPETREPRPDGEVGEIWVSGPGVARGYWRRAGETASTFAAELASGDSGRYLRTGDLGFVLDGELHVSGRITDLLVLGHRAYYPTDVEWACQERVPALRRNCGAAFTAEIEGRERLVVVHEVKERPRGDYEELLDPIRGAVAGALGVEVGAIRLIEPRTIPRTSSGKIRRGRCRELFVEGGLNTVAEWP